MKFLPADMGWLGCGSSRLSVRLWYFVVVVVDADVNLIIQKEGVIDSFSRLNG